MSTQTLQNVSVGSLKSWRTGVINPHNVPVLILETNEGVSLSVIMPPQTAIELGKSLQTDGARTLQAAPKAAAAPSKAAAPAKKKKR